jgi:hypothetical protein
MRGARAASVATLLLVTPFMGGAAATADAAPGTSDERPVTGLTCAGDLRQEMIVDAFPPTYFPHPEDAIPSRIGPAPGESMVMGRPQRGEVSVFVLRRDGTARLQVGVHRSPGQGWYFLTASSCVPGRWFTGPA